MKRKFLNKPTVVDGVRFASQREAARYGELKLLERAREISGLTCHPKWELRVEGRDIGTYTADFSYWEGRYHGDESNLIVEDVKSPATLTQLFRWKAKHLRAQYGIVVKVVM